MTILYQRRMTVEVAGLKISEPRIRAEIERQPDATQAKARVGIYNLSPSHEQRIYERGGPVVVSAGYPATVAIIFDGHVQRVVRIREHLARITWIHAGDLVRAPGLLGGSTSRSYEGPVATRDIARDLITDIGLPPGPLDAIPEDASYTDWVYSGPAASALTTLLRTVNCRWFEQDNLIRINRVEMAQPDAPAIDLSPDSGLVGAPSVTDEGAEIRMLLNPLVQLGSVINLESVTLTGKWKVVGMRHSADNWDGDFVTWCDLREIFT